MSTPLSIAATEEGERMRHTPVLLEPVIRWLGPAPGALCVDCTLGSGGHAEKLLEQSGPGGRLVGIDRDAEAIEIARERLDRFGDRFIAVHADFRDIRGVLARLDIGTVDAILADLGVSSMQLLDPARGFGFASGPLDMRMDRSRGETAGALLAHLDQRGLETLLKRYGEEPRARAIARSIVRAREMRPIETASRLAEIVSNALPFARGERLHPATRTFMALRIAVNDELAGIDRFIEDSVEALRPAGRIAVISFHSLEDRAVKRALRMLANRCTCPPDLPVCGCGRANRVSILTRKAETPTREEREENPRSRSAKLRVAEKI